MAGGRPSPRLLLKIVESREICADHLVLAPRAVEAA